MDNLSIIAAIDLNGLIGNSNHLPWHVKEDLQYFRNQTMGHTVVMGKKTWLSLGKPLDGRVNIILTHESNFHIPGCITMNSIEQVLQNAVSCETFIIGGANVFQQFMPYVSTIFLSRIAHAFSGDTYFPTVNWSEWDLISYEQITTTEGYDISFEKWQRKPVKR